MMDNTTRTITNLKNGGSVESETAVLNAPNDGAGRVPTILADSSTRTVPLPVAIETLRAKPRDEEIQRATCLASRSDFTDFYSQTVLDEAVDEVAAKRLELQLEDALRLLPRGKFFDSVSERLVELKLFCRNMKNGSLLELTD